MKTQLPSYLEANPGSAACYQCDPDCGSGCIGVGGWRNSLYDVLDNDFILLPLTCLPEYFSGTVMAALREASACLCLASCNE